MCVYPRSARADRPKLRRGLLPCCRLCATWLVLTTCGVCCSMVGGMRAQLYKDCLRLVFHVASEVICLCKMLTPRRGFPDRLGCLATSFFVGLLCCFRLLRQRGPHALSEHAVRTDSHLTQHAFLFSTKPSTHSRCGGSSSSNSSCTHTRRTNQKSRS